MGPAVNAYIFEKTSMYGLNKKRSLACAKTHWLHKAGIAGGTEPKTNIMFSNQHDGNQTSEPMFVPICKDMKGYGRIWKAAT